MGQHIFEHQSELVGLGEQIEITLGLLHHSDAPVGQNQLSTVRQVVHRNAFLREPGLHLHKAGGVGFMQPLDGVVQAGSSYLPGHPDQQKDTGRKDDEVGVASGDEHEQRPNGDDDRGDPSEPHMLGP